MHSIERVLAELEFISAHQRRSRQHYVVPIHDDAFALLPVRAKNLCEAIVNRKLKLRLSCIARADSIDSELLKLMRAAGFVSLAFGLESAVPSVLRAAGKVRPPAWPEQDLSPERHYIEQVRKAVISAKKLGFNVGVSIILGLPTETAADGETTLRFLRTLPIDYYTHNFLKLYPGTPLWDAHARYGLDCSIGEMGLPETTRHAYKLESLHPSPRCAREVDAGLIRVLAADAMFNCQTLAASVSGISTVVIESEELTVETAEWLREVLAVGGIVLQLYPSLRYEQLEKRIQRDRCTMIEHLVPVRYYIQVESTRTRNGLNRYAIACSAVDLYRKHRLHLLPISSTDEPSPMFDWMQGVSTSCELCEVSLGLLESAELVRLRHQLASAPALLERMPIPPQFRYPGRWLKETSTCKSLRRLEVDSWGNVRCCCLGPPIGKVGDSKEDLVRRLSQMVRAVERKRACRRCSRTACPKCPFPGLDDEKYCTTMTQRAPELRTLNWIWSYSRLPSIMAHARDRMAAR